MNQEIIRKLSRVQQAHDEVGVTTIRYSSAIWFVVIWLLLLFGVLVVDHRVEWNQQKDQSSVVSLRSLKVVRDIPEITRKVSKGLQNLNVWIAANRHLLELIKQTEKNIEEQGAIASYLRPWSQRMLLLFGVGNEKVYPANDSWLFYRPDVDYITGPGFLEPQQLLKRSNSTNEWEAQLHPNPTPAIIDFHRQLAARNIKLLVVPVPIKAEILPDKFSSLFPANRFIRNPSYQLFLDQLSEAKVWVADIAKWMVEYQVEYQKPAFLVTDTHWTPSAMQWVSSRLSTKLSQKVTLSDVNFIPTKTSQFSLSNHGDIAAMLNLPTIFNTYPVETVTVESVQRIDGLHWQESHNAEVLVLGDSFSNIYSLDSMGWGASAGFVEHLSHSLQHPIDRIIRNDKGSFATRQLLSRELARGRDRLAGKKVVIYQFATRELAFGDWRFTPLQLKQVESSKFLGIKSGVKLRVHGTVQSISTVISPGSVPYRDHIISIHLVDIWQNESPQTFSQAVVYVQSMKNNVLMQAARIRPGDELELTLSNWSDVADQFGSLNRSELDEMELQLQEPVWGELQEK